MRFSEVPWTIQEANRRPDNPVPATTDSLNADYAQLQLKRIKSEELAGIEKFALRCEPIGICGDFLHGL